MKTWWDFLPSYIVLALLPFVIGAIPTVQLFGEFWGGGPIRQYCINWVAHCLPADARDHLVNSFMQSSAGGEYLLYLPIALNLALALLWMNSAVAGTQISLSNWYSSRKYQSTRKAAKE